MVKEANIDDLVANESQSTLSAQLTPNELYFCELKVRGSSLTDAFIKAYPDSPSVKGDKRASIGVQACKLAKRPHIVAWLKKVGESISAPAVYAQPKTKDHKRAILAELMDNSVDDMVRLRAIEIDNKMAGHEAPRATVNLSPSVSIADKLLAQFAGQGEQKQIAEPKPVEIEGKPVQ